MGKVSPVSSKYIVHARITIDGIVDQPDVIGAIFGQTEGLLGSELELREAQRSGRIGRIEVNTEIRSGKTSGLITIPSSLDKAETAIIAAAMETIQRIGPCNSRVRVEKIEDIRISKRKAIVERAKILLKELMDNVLPDSQEITDEVAQSVRMMEICEYGKDKLAAGPTVDESEELIIVEGRADVLTMLKHGFKNCIAVNGTNIPETVIELGNRKIVTLFVDGDRGGDLIAKELASVIEIDFITKAPDGKEVEELTKKEIHKALRARVAFEQGLLDQNGKERHMQDKPQMHDKPRTFVHPNRVYAPNNKPQFQQKKAVSQTLPKQQMDLLKNKLDDLMGTRGAYILNQNLEILGKVPVFELTTTLKGLTSGYAVVFDGTITPEIANAAETAGVKFLVAMDSKIQPTETNVNVLTNSTMD